MASQDLRRSAGSISRQRGSVTEWNDERGFGFITPQGSGARVFVHISGFTGRQRRPQAGDKVRYALGSDAQGRPRCVNVTFDGEAPRVKTEDEIRGPRMAHWAVALVFLGCTAAAAVTGRLPMLVPAAYLASSCASYMLYAFDKSAALRDRWRTNEDTLHALALLGGWPGALLAQHSFRHKTQKRSFRSVFWLTVLLNCAFTGWLASPWGTRALHALA